MSSKVTPRLIELTYEAALKSFWRKNALKKFLRASHISESYLATWDLENETKRDFLDRAFIKLQTSKKGQAVIEKMSKNLSEFKSFPDLRNWEDSDEKISKAYKAVEELKYYLKSREEKAQKEKTKQEIKKRAREKRAEIQRSLNDKKKLQTRLDSLHKEVGTREGGYKFQKWFYDFLDYFDIDNRKPYNSKGRQIDGSLTHNGTTYLVELKFTGNQTDVTEIDSLKTKVEDKADNTMGIMVSISGYSSVAIESASGKRSLLLLLDAQHIYMALAGTLKFDEIISRVRRHASQTGESFLKVSGFGG
ncbi:restriction endonuclease [Fodinibius sediminis]|uniref:Restriction endonuclease n=1 Tax=Fodinibius sediminis TaxID=1214077 RepID=A0A521F8N5_9BACT|nr:restriction endonuclease [Fodinibius sediminis]SMO92528.1 Restriction endonuclease [Fodinibius sediminis]